MITDEMLAQAADAYVQIMVENIPDLPEYRHSFSARFERKIRRIIHRGSHPVLYRTMRAAGYAVAALVLSFLTLMAVNPSARAAVMDWIREMYGTYSHNYYSGDEEVKLSNIHVNINYLPENYTLLYTNQTFHNITFYYENDAGERLYINCSLNNMATEYFYELDSYLVEAVSINNSSGEYFQSVDHNCANYIQWTHSETNIFVTISGFFEKDVLINIAKKIEIKN